MVQIVDISQSLYRIWSVGQRVIRQTKRDRRTVGALIINPIILMLLIGYAFSGTFTGINLGIVELNLGPVQESVLGHLQASNIFSITYFASESEARKRISDETLNGAVVLG
jgi:ABC-2 type transport system permease protein